VGQGAVEAAGSALALERFQRPTDPPAVAGCTPLEPPTPRPVETASSPGVTAFLDGVQRSRVVGHVQGSPLVHGTVAAAVRRREARQLATWGEPRVRHALFLVRSHVGEDVWALLAAAGIDPVDIGDDALPPHPMAVRARALERVAQERESLERRLAADWCRREHDWLWVDGGISGNLAIDETACAFGVVKSHTTLYGDEDAIRATLALRAGERSPAFLITHRARRAVASWYLRLRTSADGDPLHALVRVEVAPPPALANADPQAPRDEVALARFTAHADRLSSWILAERMPLARPDPRWDTLTYGVYACEAYLKAIIGS
jgi:hypothetical protein